MPKLVIYMSGKKSTKKWHRECDSVAASVTVSKAWWDRFKGTLLGDDFDSSFGELLPWISDGELADPCSDMAEEDDEEAVAVLSMLECSASCGVVHVVTGRA